MKIAVKGMMCRGCEERIEKALGAMGLKNVKADRVEGAVSYEGNADIAEIKSTIEDLGFDVNA